MFLLLKYLDKYSLQQSQSYLHYTILRKSYLIIEKKEHLLDKGFSQIKKYQETLLLLTKGVE